MTLEELKNIMPNCVNCGRHCPIDDLHCEKGKEMVDRILAEEITPEECIKKAEERRKEREHCKDRRPEGHHRNCRGREDRPFRGPEGRPFRGPENMPFGGPEGKPFRGPENMPFGGLEGRPFRGPENMPFGGPDGRPFQGPQNMPFHGPEFFSGQKPDMDRMPRLPQDESLNSLLFFAAHAVRPRRAKGERGMEGMAQHRVLKLLGETSSISQQSLQEILAIRPGSLSELLKKLEDKGLILRTPDDNDRRKNTLSLTDAGRDTLKATEEQRDPFNMLTEEEQETLKTLLKKIIEGNR